MLVNTLWGVASSLLGFFYAGIQVMVPCFPPAPIPTAVINTDEYMGSWYFVAAAAWDESDLKSSQAIDSFVLHIQKGVNDTLMMTESTRLGDQCQKNNRSYYYLSGMYPFLLKTGSDSWSMVWEGKLINCPSCIIILFVDEEEGEAKVSLFARDEKTLDEVIEKFKSKMDCVSMGYFIKPPLKNGYCKLDEAP